jgi:hypothetical protein
MMFFLRPRESTAAVTQTEPHYVRRIRARDREIRLGLMLRP